MNFLKAKHCLLVVLLASALGMSGSAFAAKAPKPGTVRRFFGKMVDEYRKMPRRPPKKSTVKKVVGWFSGGEKCLGCSGNPYINCPDCHGSKKGLVWGIIGYTHGPWGPIPQWGWVEGPCQRCGGQGTLVCYRCFGTGEEPE